MVTTSTASARRAAVGPPLAAEPQGAQGHLVVHLVSAGAWIGIDVVVAVLVAAGWFSDDPSVRAAAYQALGLFVVLLRPGLAEVREHGQSVSAGGPGTVDVTELFFPPAVSLSALTLATVLAVFKPWGRIRSGPPS